MRINLHKVQDFEAFEAYFGDDAPQRKMDFFMEAHADKLGVLLAPQSPLPGEALVFQGKEYVVLNRLWEFTDQDEYEIKLLLGEVDEDDGDGEMS